MHYPKHSLPTMDSNHTDTIKVDREDMDMNKDKEGGVDSRNVVILTNITNYISRISIIGRQDHPPSSIHQHHITTQPNHENTTTTKIYCFPCRCNVLD